MGKVITERERRGSSDPCMKYRKSIAWKGFDADYHEPKRAKVSANGQYGWNHREFTDVLGPIYRWLRAQVNRPWNNVYQEMCEVLDKRKLTHKHVFDHVKNYVQSELVYKGKDGQFYVRGRFSWKDTDPPVDGLFVDPRTGILRKQKPRPEKVETKPVEEIKRQDGKYYKKVNGIWYLCSITKFDPREVVGYKPNPYAPELMKRPIFRRDTKMPLEIVENKRQLNTKELEKLGVKNERPD